MMPIEDRWITNYQKVTVMMKDGTVITGKVNIGESPRTSDLFRQSSANYIILTEAELKGESGKVVMVNTSEIMWVELE